MIGLYDYTVVLTYLSLMSATTGILVSLSGAEGGHPYIGLFFLLFCGLCDAFDGKVAHTKKKRTELEKNFGIQIDSLSDLIAFGVLPACIGVSLLRRSYFFQNIFPVFSQEWYFVLIRFLIYSIFVLYVLAALIRLAYFNVTEEERQKKEDGVRKTYTGLPVTSSALIFPFILLLQLIIPFDISILYFIAMILVGLAFLCKFTIRKPGMKGILFLVLFGVLEFLFLLIFL